MTNTNQRSDGRFMSGMFFHVLPGQIILALSVNCDTMDDWWVVASGGCILKIGLRAASKL